MLSVERVLEYRDLKQEIEADQPIDVAKNWPSEGDIHLRNVRYRYCDETEPVLNDISFSIKSNEKIGEDINLQVFGEQI